MTVMYDEETEEVKRIIILSVQLDHVAATRIPANPDSVSMAALRTAITKALSCRKETVEVSEQGLRIGDVESLAGRVAKIVTQNRKASVGNDTGKNLSSVTDNMSTVESLDTPVKTGDDATKSNRETSVLTSFEDINMTPEQIADLVQRAATKAIEGSADTITASVRTATSGLEGRLSAIEARFESRSEDPTPATPEAAPAPAAAATESSEIAALRSTIESLRGSVNRLAAQPVRRGIHGSPMSAGLPVAATEAEAHFRSIVSHCTANRQGIALAAVVERNISVLSGDPVEASVNGNGSVRSLKRLLSAGIRAASADGLIQNRAVGSWR
jgi:hypothetical protein